MRPPKNNLSRIRNVLIILITLIVLSFSIFIFQKYHKQKKIVNNDIEIPESSVKISLLNGCGYPGIAKEVKDILIEKKKIDIISWRNNRRNMFIYKKTIIVVKKENEKKLNYLMNITGIKRRIYAYNDDLIEDYQIILGKDYKQYFK